LIAGIIIGPTTPGFVADVDLAQQLAEIGVMLLMFGVGLHFSLADLLAVRRIALPGAVAQAGPVFMGQHELALGMTRHILDRVDPQEAKRPPAGGRPA
jgi:predicted Kef-type K+ transport protein